MVLPMKLCVTYVKEKIVKDSMRIIMKKNDYILLWRLSFGCDRYMQNTDSMGKKFTAIHLRKCCRDDRTLQHKLTRIIYIRPVSFPSFVHTPHCYSGVFPAMIICGDGFQTSYTGCLFPHVGVQVFTLVLHFFHYFYLNSIFIGIRILSDASHLPWHLHTWCTPSNVESVSCDLPSDIEIGALSS